MTNEPYDLLNNDHVTHDLCHATLNFS